MELYLFVGNIRSVGRNITNMATAIIARRQAPQCTSGTIRVHANAVCANSCRQLKPMTTVMPVPFERWIICPVLIGRAAQLDALERRIALARAGNGQVALVVGEAGIGKSRLVAEVQARAVQQGFVILQGRCSICYARSWLPTTKTRSPMCWGQAPPNSSCCCRSLRIFSRMPFKPPRSHPSRKSAVVSRR